MTLVHLYYNPITKFDRLFGDVLAAQSCPRPASAAKEETSRHNVVYRPRLDLHKSGDTDTVTATFELPGLTSDNITIDVQKNRLTVSGESVITPSDEKNYVVRERRAGKFSRTLQLPYGTKPEDVKAKMENGILTITFPKTAPEQEVQRIVIE